MCIDINFTRLGAGVYFVALLHIEHYLSFASIKSYKILRGLKNLKTKFSVINTLALN